MELKIRMPLCWKQIIESDKNFFLIPTGRISGKSKNTVIFSTMIMMQFPYHDIVVTRSSYGSMSDSSYAEFKAQLNELPEALSSQFVLRKSPLRIERVGDSGTVYFMGAGGSNKDRTKGLKTQRPVKIVVVEECQEFKTQESYDQFMASVRRNFGDDVKVFVLGNPPAIKVHWFNLFVNLKEQDKDWLVVRMSWLDIIDFLNDYDIKDILKCKILEPERYEWMYMGVPTGGFGLCYPMFSREKHIITLAQYEKVIQTTSIRPVACVIGVDGAVTRDCTVAVPGILLSNGQCVVGPIFYHNPNDSGVLGSHQLVQLHMSRWFNEIQRRFNLGTLQEKAINPRTNLLPIYFVIDSAATDLIQECRFFFSNRANVNKITKPSIFEMVSVGQSAIMNNNYVIIDYGGYYDYVLDRWVNKKVNLLEEQLTSLIWNEKQTGYEPTIPNDVSDAWTYQCNYWYGNQENIQFFNIMKMKNIQNLLISDIIVK